MYNGSGFFNNYTREKIMTFLGFPQDLGGSINQYLSPREQVANERVCKAAGKAPNSVKNALFTELAMKAYKQNPLRPRVIYREQGVVDRPPNVHKLNPSVKTYAHDQVPLDKAMLTKLRSKTAFLDQLNLTAGNLNNPVGPCVKSLVANSAHIRALDLPAGLAAQLVPSKGTDLEPETLAAKSLLTLLEQHPTTFKEIKFTSTRASDILEIHPRLQKVGFTNRCFHQLGRFFIYTLEKGT